MWKISGNPVLARQKTPEFSFFVCLCIVEGCIIHPRINNLLKTLWGKLKTR